MKFYMLALRLKQIYLDQAFRIECNVSMPFIVYIRTVHSLIISLYLFYRNEANVIILKSRYSNLYIPSDFFQANFTWTSAFPLFRPFQLGTDCTFHVMPKDTEPITLNDAESNTPTSEPTDADHLYSAKVRIFFCIFILKDYYKICNNLWLI